LRLPKSFVEGAQVVALHRHPGRWDLLYRLLWRLREGPGGLMQDITDEDVAAFWRMHKAVQQDVHNCHAYVRFRPMPDAADAPTSGGRPHYVAWYEPDHLCLPLAVPHFVERFATMDWTLVTPDASATWRQSTLTVGPGGTYDRSLGEEDAIGAMWRTYYASIFNPARVNLRATKQHMPQRFWKNMPETQLIAPMQRAAGAQTEVFMASQPPRPLTQAHYDTLEAVKKDVRGCSLCPWAEQSTQGVMGEGHENQTLMVVGEQPGDMEDRVGRPFVGPAGQLLAQAFTQAGIRRDQAYVTNAVKHFKFELRGKRRIHQKPNAADVAACKAYLAAEWALVRPKVLLCLGTTAALAVLGKAVKLKDVRGQVLKTSACDTTFVTTHPSALLRMPPEAQEAGMALFVADLKRVRQLVDAA
jgi:DNA polymerase